MPFSVTAMNEKGDIETQVYDRNVSDYQIYNAQAGYAGPGVLRVRVNSNHTKLYSPSAWLCVEDNHE